MQIQNNAELLQHIADLTARIEQLERARSIRPNHKPARRNKLLIAFASIGLLAAGTAAAATLTGSGVYLQQFMDYSNVSISQPALDTVVRWSRTDVTNVGPGYTNEVLSLVAEANQQNSYTWPLYIQLSGTNNAGADQNTSQSAGATVRAFTRSTGSPWLAGYHSEIFHGKDGLSGPTLSTQGTSLLYNGELDNYSATGTTIGLNLQNTANSTQPGTHAINIQSGSATAVWRNGIHFEGPGNGNIGINFDAAHYNMGIDLGDNSLRMNAGQKLVLERYGTIYFGYNPTTGRVELVKGGTVVASW